MVAKDEEMGLITFLSEWENKMNECQAKREKQIPSELGRLDKAISELSVAIDVLGERLGSVLRSSTPVCVEDHKEGEAECCAVSGEIAVNRRRVEKILGLIRELTDRLEV